MTDDTPADLGTLADTSDETLRWIDLTRTGPLRYRATNRRGGVLPVGSGDDEDFTPIELLLAALAGCGAIDLEHITRKRSDPESFDVRAEGHKIRDQQGNRMTGLTVTFSVEFPDDEAGAAARAVVPRAVQQVQDRLCTVGRTVTVGDPVRYTTS